MIANRAQVFLQPEQNERIDLSILKRSLKEQCDENDDNFNNSTCGIILSVCLRAKWNRPAICGFNIPAKSVQHGES
jgi:hypothetical protein